MRRIRGQVEAAKASVEKASLDLGYTRVTSPITGLVGTTEVKPGNLVGRGESVEALAANTTRNFYALFGKATP